MHRRVFRKHTLSYQDMKTGEVKLDYRGVMAAPLDSECPEIPPAKRVYCKLVLPLTKRRDWTHTIAQKKKSAVLVAYLTVVYAVVYRLL